ncbi:LysE family translocator [Chromohalobacter canadensis]|uniref:LysE family translocator n=1 Tax=Chromohalobacter canadensis TaxID=141389 RepID=A0ABZ0YFQ7_9GAMM|nr:LysE family translocator [Chromohalobacter canadensis]MCK0770059.1 LysE family translocator [Chromohalobacter canadensis]WQH10563.1 LysE family translocator [Chromohalobacter canadensis]
MCDYSLVHWLAFLSAAVLLNLSPGPDIAFMLGQTLRSGRRYGFAAMLGGWSGTALHVAMAAAGLSAILATSALAFSVIKWVGAAYLIWLGVKMLLSKGDSFVSNSGSHDAKARSVYWQGVLVSVLNPKVAIFFLAFLPQFVVQGAGPVGAQLFLHGSLIIVVAAFYRASFGNDGSEAGRFLEGKPASGDVDGSRPWLLVRCFGGTFSRQYQVT